MALALPEKLIDKPSFTANAWKGYQHFIDPTLLDFSTLTFPSQNCSIPMFDKVVPDKGKTLLGQPFNELNVGIIGNKQKFKNMGGVEMEVRVWPSAGPTLKDVIEVYFDNNRIVFNTLIGVFTVGEQVTGGTSGATGQVSAVVGTVLFLINIVGTFVSGETITGATSGATANVVTANERLFHQITESTNPLPRGVHEYYFDEWFDTNLNPAISKNLPRLIWVNGYRDTNNPVGGLVFSWTGGLAVITSFVANTSISINPSTTWRSLGFSEDASGNSYVVVNGVSHQLTNVADLDTSTISVASTAGVAIGDIASARIESTVSPIPFDVCRNNKGYMFYGNWDSRDLYMSNAFNRPDTITASSIALQNDLVLDLTSPYTGTVESTFKISIDSVNPEIEKQEFISGGPGNQNNGVYDTSGYSGTPGDTNIYDVKIIADMTMGISDLTLFPIGHTVRGQTSNALAIVVAKHNVIAPAGLMGVKMLTATRFVSFETIENLSNANTLAIGTADNTNWFEYAKNGIVINTNVGFGSFPANVVIVNTPITLSNGLTITFGAPNGTGGGTGGEVGDQFLLTINKGGRDTFTWQQDNQAAVTGVQITGGNQLLNDGVTIKFLNINGHTLGDTWTIRAVPNVGTHSGSTFAFANFYYALPVRKPGEGYKYRLPSNFWAMDTQEESMYVNGSYGEWSFISTTLSGDLQSEDVSLTPLKQVGALKVIYPYMTGHINDDLIFVSVDKKLNTLGRKEYLEKPQSGYLSEPVDLDFKASSFIGGRIQYLNKNIYISSPQDAILHNYDTHQRYWNPPKSFPEVGLLSVVGNDLVAHSNVLNQSFTMFTSDTGDNGQAYDVEIRTSYTPVGNRWNKKFSNMSFVEGYIQGNPILTHTIYLGVEGCGGIFPHTISPIVCLFEDRAPFGQGPFGSHPNGSDLAIEGYYFQEIYKGYAPVLEYYFIQLGIKCAAKSHTWSLLSMGMNGMYSTAGNNLLVNPTNLVT